MHYPPVAAGPGRVHRRDTFGVGAPRRGRGRRVDVGKALAAVRRRWVLLVVVVVLGLLAGAANFVVTPKSYKSTTNVLFSLNRGGSLSELADGNNYVQDLV